MRPTTSEGFMGGRGSGKPPTVAGTDSFVSASMSGGGGLGPSASPAEEPHAPGVAPMTYFLADEATVNAAAMTRSSESLGSTGAFGVHSLSSSGSTSSGGTKKDGAEGSDLVELRRGSGAVVRGVGDEQPQEYEEELYGKEESHDRSVHRAHQNPETAVNQGGFSSSSPRRQVSAPSSPFLGILKSPRSCGDFSEVASQAVISGGEEEGEEEEEEESFLGSPPLSSSASPAPRPREKRKTSSTDIMAPPPQFIMPTIKMPSRRPFTNRGRNVGRLKILVAGDSGNILLCR